MDIPFGNKQFTHQGDPEIKKYIRDLLERITSMILMKITPVAVFLYGSIGRGEGTLYREDGQLIVASDFEVGCVSKRWSDRKRLPPLKEKIEHDIGHEVTLSFFLPKRIKLSTSSNFTFSPSRVPTIESYEISESAFFLYGNDIRTNVSYSDPSRIPLWEGLRLVFNRMAEFAIAFQNGNNNQKIKALNKIKIACGDAILITINKYHYLYSQRLGNLQEYRWEIQKRNPALKDKHIEFIKEGYAWKLFPQENSVAINKVDYEQLYEVVEIVFKYIIFLDMNISFIDYDKFANEYLKNNKLKKDYYKEFHGHPLVQNTVKLLQKRISFRTFLDNVRCSQSLIHQAYSLVPKIFFEQLDHLIREQSVSLSGKDKGTLQMYERLLT